MSNSYTIKIAQFEGPFDLLLFFIERDELDIYNIPISKITKDFLEFIKEMESMNIDLASEFIVVAASLMRIKAKMLLPRKELNEAGEEIDPREELVSRLLEYKRYKGILEEMRVLEEIRYSKEYRGNVSSELKKIANVALVDAELESLSLYKILATFKKVMERFEDENRVIIHKVVHYDYSLPKQKSFIMQKIMTGVKVTFQALFKEAENRTHAVFTFLAMLELIQGQQIRIEIREGVNNFWLSKGNEAYEPT